MLRLLASAAAGALISAAATAADLPLPVEPIEEMVVAPTPSWTGIYAGAHGAGVWGEGDVNIPLYPSTFTLDTEGWGAGGFVGVNFQASSFVFGLEADGTWLDVDGSNPSGLPGERYRVDQQWDASVRGRVGIAFDNILLFGTGGAAFTELETRYIPLAGGTDSATYTGWTAGGGVEMMWGPAIGRLMYRYSDYGSEGFFHNGPSTVDYSTHMIMGGVGIKFGNLFAPR